MRDSLLSVTDLVEYMYCPRKFYLRKIKGIRQPANKKMILGFLKHKAIETFNKTEQPLISNFDKNTNKNEIIKEYERKLILIAKEISTIDRNLLYRFKIDEKEFVSDLLKFMKKEFDLKSDSILSTINKGFEKKEIWENISPKYLTEVEIKSEPLGIKGRVDRIEILQDNKITPCEIKTVDKIYHSYEIQLAAYSLLIEKKFNVIVEKGVIETPEKRHEILIDEKIKKEVFDLIEEIKNLQDYPSINSNFKKCESCPLKEECFNINK